jgi:hypothetical protein
MRCPREKVPRGNIVRLRARVWEGLCIEKSLAHFVPAKAEKEAE